MKLKLFAFLTISIFILSSCQKDKFDNLDEGLYATIATKRGDITLQLYGKETPLTVSNFIALAEGNHPDVVDSLKGKKFYNGLKFHRVLANFMVQGGDVLGNGTGNPGYIFGDEFPKDSTGNLIYKHNKAGVFSMANGGPASNGSQFFITHKPTPWLDGVHTIFGKVIYGQNVVDSIVQNDTIQKIEIIRKGDFAEGFEAPKVFKEELALFAEKEKEEQAKLEIKKQFFLDSLGFDKAIKTSSGLKLLSLKEGNGDKVTTAQEITASLVLHTAKGKLISKSPDDKPFVFTIDKQPMIAGFKEGILTMRQGDKKRLFVPYYLGYGENANGPIPSKSDLIFELEVLKVGK